MSWHGWRRLLWASAPVVSALALSGWVLLGAGVVGNATPTGVSRWLTGVLSGERCPLSFDGADRQRVERHRRSSLDAWRGDARPGASPALGFELGRTTRGEAREWLEARATCCKENGPSALACEGVRVPGELAIDSLHVELDPTERVVAVDVFRRAASGREALAHLARVEHSLVSRVGAVTERSGSAEPAYLEARPLRRVASGFRYRSYLASLSAMNFGDGAIRVRETYNSLPEEPR